MKQKLFPILIALSALAVSGSAAFYSITGLSKLFVKKNFGIGLRKELVWQKNYV